MSCDECKWKSDYSDKGCSKCVHCKCNNGEHSNYEPTEEIDE